MSDSWNGYSGCTRAYGALAEASDNVSARLKRALEAECGLAIAEFDALVFVDEQEERGLPLAHLPARLRLSQPAVSRLVERLARRGLISRLGAENDRRSVTIRLTNDGRDLLGQAIPVHAACIRDTLLDRLTPDERDALKSILIKISG